MISDEQLRSALEECDNAIMAALPEPSDCDHQFSRQFERKMRGVCRRAKHPMTYKTLQRAACILLAMLALFGGMVAFNAEARAAVIDWINEQIGHFSHYFYAGETTPQPAERKQYELGWLPEGYQFLNSHATESKETFIYIGQTGQLMQFSYHYGASTDQIFVGGYEYQHQSGLVNNIQADIYLSLTQNENNIIIWYDYEEEVLFQISAAIEKEDLIYIAEKIFEKSVK